MRFVHMRVGTYKHVNRDTHSYAHRHRAIHTSGPFFFFQVTDGAVVNHDGKVPA